MKREKIFKLADNAFTAYKIIQGGITYEKTETDNIPADGACDVPNHWKS